MKFKQMKLKFKRILFYLKYQNKIQYKFKNKILRFILLDYKYNLKLNKFKIKNYYKISLNSNKIQLKLIVLYKMFLNFKYLIFKLKRIIMKLQMNKLKFNIKLKIKVVKFILEVKNILFKLILRIKLLNLIYTINKWKVNLYFNIYLIQQ